MTTSSSTNSPNDPPALRIPSIDRLLSDRAFAQSIELWGRPLVKRSLHGSIAASKAAGRLPAAADAPETWATIVTSQLEQEHGSAMREVLNLSGTLLHTNLGRALLPDAALQAMTAAAGNVNLEFDLATGRRGHRDSHAAALLCSLTNAPAASFVNNNAAAVLITLSTLVENASSATPHVIVSRGELVEIGGSFRIPDIIERAGCSLREVGTTNRTHLRDYTRAIDEHTVAILKVHPSNYQVNGFTAEVREHALAALAQEHGVPLVYDLGSGSLLDLSRFGLPPEATVQQAVASGADLVTFSGDKLLGGPQAGLIVGRADVIEQINAHPLKRTMRLDKVTLAALVAVLKLYGDPARLERELPLLRQLSRTTEQLGKLAGYLERTLGAECSPWFTLGTAAAETQIGSGALPTATVPSIALSLTPTTSTVSAAKRLEHYAAALRVQNPAVVGYISDDRLMFDLRSLERPELLVTQLRSALEQHARTFPADAATGLQEANAR